MFWKWTHIVLVTPNLCLNHMLQMMVSSEEKTTDVDVFVGIPWISDVSFICLFILTLSLKAAHVEKAALETSRDIIFCNTEI